MNTAIQTRQIINGIDTEQITGLAGNIQQDEDYGRFRFRASNHWLNGSRTRSRIQGFFAGGREDSSRKQAFGLDSAQPNFLGGDNSAPNPVEHLLHALASCLTTTLVYHASVQGISIGSVETSSEGELNSRGFFGISDDVSKSYERIRVNMKVKSDAGADTLRKLAMYSPVYEMVSKAVPVDFILTTN